jgi:hypothetical protein
MIKDTSYIMLKEAHIYLADSSKPAIVTAMHHNTAGIGYEQDEAIIVADWHESLSLVTALHSALERFSFRDRNLRDFKLSEWPAYRASGCRSVREFKSKYLCICVRPANKAELLYIADVHPLNESEISLCVILNPYTDDMKIRKLLLKLYDVCSRWSSVAS